VARSIFLHERLSSDDRGISPVVGTVLLIAIVVLLIGVSAVVFFGVTEERQPAPEAKLTLEPVEGNDSYVLVMQAGETIDGDQVRLRGVADSDALASRDLTAGDTVYLTPTAETIRVVWETDQGKRSTYTLQTFDIDPSSAGGSLTGFPSGTVFTGTGGDIVQIAGDGGAVTTIHSADSVEILGSPGGDVGGDGDVDLPFLTSSDEIKTVDASGDVTTVARSSDISGDDIDVSKTRVTVAAWNGAPTSVYFVGQNNDRIYRATPSGGVSEVSVTGANAVSGDGDIDGDGADELVFAGSSDTVKALQPDGSVSDLNLTLGSSTGVGAGSVGTLPGYSDEVVAAVDGGNDIYVVNASGYDEITSGDIAGSGSSPPDAKQSPPTIADVDGDDDAELVYIGNADGKIKYLDGFESDALEAKFLRDENGDKIDGDTGSGTA